MKPILTTFDVETSPLPEDWLLETYQPQFEANKTLKDPDKIAADLATKKQSWIEDSALHAERGRVLVFGYKLDQQDRVQFYEGDEKGILKAIVEFFSIWNTVLPTFAGFNILDFDLPFIRRRCLINGISFPYFDRTNRWQPWTFKTFDAMKDWGSGNYRDTISLDTVARALGVGKKNGSGKDFAKLYATNRAAALEYCGLDVTLAEAVCERLMQ